MVVANRFAGQPLSWEKEEMSQLVQNREDLTAVIRRLEGATQGTFDRHGLEKILLSARNYFYQKTGVWLPARLSTGGKLACFSLERGIPDEQGVVEETARFAGWLTYVADHKESFPYCLRFIRRTQGSLRYDPHRPFCDLWRAVELWPNPWRFESQVKRVLYQTKVLAECFGIKPSWESLREEILPMERKGVDLRPRRVARAVVLRELCGLRKRYRQWYYLPTLAHFQGFRKWANLSEELRELALDLVACAACQNLKEALSPDFVGYLVNKPVPPWQGEFALFLVRKKFVPNIRDAFSERFLGALSPEEPIWLRNIILALLSSTVEPVTDVTVALLEADDVAEHQWEGGLVNVDQSKTFETEGVTFRLGYYPNGEKLTLVEYGRTHEMYGWGHALYPYWRAELIKKLKQT